MPIYVYEPTIYSDDEQVSDCCYFEVLQSMAENPLSKCPTCMHVVHRAVTAFNVRDISFDKKGKEAYLEDGNGSSSAAKNAARLASRHLCGTGCRH